MMDYPKASYLAHRAEIDAAIARVLASGWYILGDEVAQFEAEFATYVGVAGCATVASGTDAIELALRACGVGEGAVVVLPSLTAAGSVVAVERAGARPVFVDVDSATLTMSVDGVALALAGAPENVRAVLAVHLHGRPADVGALRELTTRHGALLIEDCAQAHGARVGDRITGSIGDAAAFSFYPTKNVAALGDGGAVVSTNTAVVERAKLLRQYGWRSRHVSDVPGFNSRLDEVQAAVLRIKLRALDAENAARGANARVYDGVLADSGLVLPAPAAGHTHVYHQYVVRSSRRDELQMALAQNGVTTGIHYAVPLHEQPAYRGRIATIGPLDETSRAAATMLSLPMSPHATANEIEAIAAIVRRCALETNAGAA
jgi:dTDP-4-amino-4,6-dideoxygalactose transaminase